MQVAAEVAAMVGGETAVPRPLLDLIPPIPKAKAAHGPKTARRLLRLYGLLAAVFLLGIAPVLLDAAPRWKAFGLGLLFPGAGFLYAGGIAGPVFAVLSAALFVVIMFFWWARGVVLAPPGVLLGTALLAAAWIGNAPGIAWGEWAIPAAVLAFHGVLAFKRRQAFSSALARAEVHNTAIARAAPILRDYPVAAAAEMPKSQIGEFRRMLDLALQPVDSWSGFSMNDTWQDGALRYQICTMSWNLALGQYSQLPAFHGYLNQAQDNLIRKHIDRKTWNYWYWESLWGNLRHEKNPVHTDNIMLSGFLGVSLGLFETASGTSPFAAPGSLTFRWDENTAFPYSHSALLEEVVHNYKRYDFGWFPCEPHWIYSMCNLVGRTSLALHDARHGTNYVAQIRDVFDQTMREEMTLADGRIRVCTSSLFGFQVPSLSGLFGETWGIRFLTPHAPEQAERLWQILKQDFIHRNESGGLDFKLLPLGWDTRKPADFSKWPELNPLIMTLWAALEMGDDEIIDATRKTMDERYGEGIAASMTWSGRNTMRNMVNRGLPEAWAKGPILAQAEYPQVIVARAVSDGSALNLVLYPGADPGIVALGLGRLVPGRTYRTVQGGTQFKAGADGRHTLSVALNGRTELDVVPVA
jgi:Linalool dehydratase/isomerase